jgi:hypothetical protein
MREGALPLRRPHRLASAELESQEVEIKSAALLLQALRHDAFEAQLAGLLDTVAPSSSVCSL